MNTLLDSCAEDAVSIASKVFGVPALEIIGSKRNQATCNARHTVWLVLRLNGWKLHHISEVLTTGPGNISRGINRIKRIASECQETQDRVTQCLLKFGFDLHPVPASKPKRQKTPLCDCGQPGKTKTEGSWVCVRCSHIDREPREENQRHDPNAKYNRVFSYTLPQGSALN